MLPAEQDPRASPASRVRLALQDSRVPLAFRERQVSGGLRCMWKEGRTPRAHRFRAQQQDGWQCVRGKGDRPERKTETRGAAAEAAVADERRCSSSSSSFTHQQHHSITALPPSLPPLPPSSFLRTSSIITPPPSSRLTIFSPPPRREGSRRISGCHRPRGSHAARG